LSKISAEDYRSLASFRYEIRKFLAFSEQAARDAGIEPQQHQLLLAVKGLPKDLRPTIRTLAERLCIQHHTTVELVDKLEERGLLERKRGVEDRREVLLRMTLSGTALLQTLSKIHREQLRTVGPAMVSALGAILGMQAPEREVG
jgi:DNA-binding MarR family transcriptional regulator